MNLRRHRIHGREFISGQDFRSGAHLLNQLLESAAMVCWDNSHPRQWPPSWQPRKGGL